MPGVSAVAVRYDMVASFETRVAALYAERGAAAEGWDAAGGTGTTRLRAGPRLNAGRRESLASCEAQLDARARTWSATVERLGGRTVDETADALASYEAQLHALYAASDAGEADDDVSAPSAPDALAECVASLDAQVRALLDERAELESALAAERAGAVPSAVLAQSRSTN